MITFLYQQSDCARHVRKNENADTVNFTSQIASSICTVMFTKHVKPDATIFKSRCSRTVVCYRLNRVQALPLVSTRFLRLRSHLAENCAESREIRREMGAEHPARNPAKMSPRRVRSTSRQWPDSDNRNAAEHPSRRLARQLALRRIWTRNVRTENLRDNSQLGRATAEKHLAR